jgi:hypothetical protein
MTHGLSVETPLSSSMQASLFEKVWDGAWLGIFRRGSWNLDVGDAIALRKIQCVGDET